MIMNDNNFIGIFFYEEMQKKCSRNMSSDLNLPSIEIQFIFSGFNINVRISIKILLNSSFF